MILIENLPVFSNELAGRDPGAVDFMTVSFSLCSIRLESVGSIPNFHAMERYIFRFF